MIEDNFILREPLLDPKQRVIGFQFSWQQADSNAQLDSQNLDYLLEFVAGHLNDDDGFLLADSLVFLEALPELLHADGLKSFPPKNTVLILHKKYFADESTLEAVKELRALGFGICLRGAEVTTLERSFFAFVSHIEVQLNAANFASQAKVYASLKQSSVKMVARNVSTWQDFDACAALGLDSFVGKLHLIPRPSSAPKSLNPAQTTILQLMEMVRKNADVQQLELVVKRDATLAYKLLRYINSAGFGLRTEIQSLKHAVQMLGYSPLYRWLTVLLATASTSGYSPVLLETAIVRGRFAELLGQMKMPKSEAENLFVAGMFSLLDRLLGLPMEDVLSTIQLPEVVTEALISREGVFGPYLALAEACELNSMLVGSLAESLKISAEDVNTAHLAALVWAKNVATAA
ncbi:MULTISPECIES: EAL and HDOD domain-containing protein [Undibacterium]|uniref:HDOD domain-containing protein n=1 Tax=Undibacterium aquatile TaxID=1537398 RepID=A0ABR6XDT5_9BURK|nr:MULTISPECIES: HDOD domain-containing protein [Undibacterium]MBC3810760.1 HDOD domain-containing protein [Undibacterium aquatile]MBC3879017.1 HDOD domain-containing protein [Undibacterium sp. FT79W]MBK1890999.1 HDOD domain-containing protein [Undibacterium sp. 14-3-2]